MKQYIFYTFEGIAQSPIGETVENMQILGFSSGKNKNAAKVQLLKDNKWIVESGFSEQEIQSRQVVDEKLKELIKKIILYSWDTEKRHYEENPEKNHIFLVLKKLKELIN